MQIGIDVGATKIESVILEDNDEESHRSRIHCPKDYYKIIDTIKDIVNKLEQEKAILEHYGDIEGVKILRDAAQNLDTDQKHLLKKKIIDLFKNIGDVSGLVEELKKAIYEI